MIKFIFSILLACLLWNNAFGEAPQTALQKELIAKCLTHHPGARNVSEGWGEYQNIFCMWFCTGKEQNGTFFWENFSTDDGTKCEPFANLLMKEKNTEPRQCYNQKCLVTSEMDLCKASLKKRKLVSLVTEECRIACYGSDNVVVIEHKPVGSSCEIAGRGSEPAQCNANYFCISKPNFVALPKGAFNASSASAQATCFTRNTEDKEPVATIDNFDPCRFTCSYLNSTGGGYMEIMYFNDGVPCIADKKCMNGKCLAPSVIDICDGHTKRIEVVECKVACYSDTEIITTILPVNSSCLKNPWNMPGTCDAQGNCK